MNPTEFCFECPECGQRISATHDAAGITASCPTCSAAFAVPAPQPAAPAPAHVPKPAACRTRYKRVLVAAGSLAFIAVSVIGWRWIADSRDHANRGKDAGNVAPDLAAADAGSASTASHDFLEIKELAERGDVEAQNSLGKCYDRGDGVGKDLAEAVRWFRKAAEQGNAKAQFNLGLSYAQGDGVGKDLVEAARWYRKAGEQGEAKAQFNLGLLYAQGDGVAKDLPEAARWFRKSAEQEEAKAQNILGLFYARGDGVGKDLAEAARWFRKSAEQGNAKGQRYLAQCYYSGDGVSKSLTEAAQWYRKSAEQGDSEAQRVLGNCYFSGLGVPQDRVEGVRWFRKSADQGDKRSQASLGVCYADGSGVPKDLVQAVHWYRKAAEQGETESQRWLGICYGNGVGVPRDYVEAYKWLNLSAATDVEGAKETLTEIERKMTGEQIAEAQRLAREFKPRKTGELDATASPADVAESDPSASGTGFFITDDGFVMTNAHVVAKGAKFQLVTRAGTVAAKVVKVDVANDLALLKGEGRFAPLPVAPSRPVRLGSTVATVGFPNIFLQGFAPKLAKGEIAALSGAQDDARYFQISVPVQPGNSGGALVDEHGNAVGIVAAKLSASAALAGSGALPENVNYAVKSSYILGFLESVPDIAVKLKEPNTKDTKFEDVANSAEQAAVLVLVY